MPKETTPGKATTRRYSPDEKAAWVHLVTTTDTIKTTADLVISPLAGRLRPGVSATQATDVLFAVSSPEMYDLLVVRSGWSPRRYTGFVATTIENALL